MTEHDTAALEAQQAKEASPWLVVTQVKSNRVVYFTDDPDYQPPGDGEWYYVSGYAGVLPAGMTLRNCWAWRFTGGLFVDARDPEPAPTHERLLTNNRNALLRLLNEKIDAVREPFSPTARDGHEIRLLKLAQAQHYRQARSDGSIPASGEFGLLEAVAVARHISLLEAAALIESRARACTAVWVESERFREQLTQAILRADTDAQLLELREWLLDKIYPALTERFKFRVDNTTPPDLDAVLLELHRAHEIDRLKVQLREAINRKRSNVASDYVLNDEVRKHKLRIARSVLESGAIPPAGIDAGLLENYATSRGLSLIEAAQLMSDAAGQAAELLIQTELVKDRLLGRIDALQTLRDIHSLDAELENL